MNNPWEHPLGKKIWKTKAAYFTWLRGNLRRIWQDNPLRKEWKKNQLRLVTKEEKEAKMFHPSTKNVGECYLCLHLFPGSKLQCDHLEESTGCYDHATATEFLGHCAWDDPSNWRLVCVPCHKIKSHATSRGVSFEEARAEKQAIQIIKEKKDKAWLEERGVVPGKNLKTRREQIIGCLREGL